MIKIVPTLEDHKFHFRLDGVKGNKPTAALVCLGKSKDDNTFKGCMELHNGMSTFQKINLEIKISSLARLEACVKRVVDDLVSEYFESKGKSVVSDFKYEEK